VRGWVDITNRFRTLIQLTYGSKEEEVCKEGSEAPSKEDGQEDRQEGCKAPPCKESSKEDREEGRKAPSLVDQILEKAAPFGSGFLICARNRRTFIEYLYRKA